MKKILLVSGAFITMFISGCATIVEGNDQTILFNTSPPGATCNIMRDGGVLYSGLVTPTSLSIEKDKDQLVITCEKEGYHMTTITTNSNFEGWTVGNLIFGGIIGLGVDAASGAMNEYPSQVLIPLAKE